MYLQCHRGNGRLIGGLRVPAMDDDRPAEQVLEGVDPLAELQQQLGVFGDPVVRPAGELDLGHLPLSVIPLLKGTHTHQGEAETEDPRTSRGMDRPRWAGRSLKGNPNPATTCVVLCVHYDVHHSG